MDKLLFSAFLLLQSVISIKPGFVDLVDGKTNVRKYAHIAAGEAVQTGPGSHVQIGLGLDSLLRLDENSTAVFESLETSDVSVRIQSGSALVEVPKLEKPNRIRVTTGSIQALIDSKGVFHFSQDGVWVADGRLKTDVGIAVQKGWYLSNSGGEYRQAKRALATPGPFKSFLNSPKAGFVNAVRGQANVRPFEVARQDQPIKTGPSSFVELLLSPGSFMRLDENSEVIIDSAGLSDVVIKVVSGLALIESVAVDPRFPIRVSVGDAKPWIATGGLYRFTSDTASVIDGALRIGQKGDSAFAGTQVRFVNNQYHAEDMPADPDLTGLDLWSAERSRLLARANFMADYSDSYPNFYMFVSQEPYLAAWMHSPSLNGITFVPRLKRESYYGNSFVPIYVLVPKVPAGPTPLRIPTPNRPPLPTSTPAPRSEPMPVPAATPAPAPAPPPPSTPASAPSTAPVDK